MSSQPQTTQPPAKLEEGESLVNILTKGIKVKALSGPSKDAKNVLDGSLETCWTAENRVSPSCRFAIVPSLTFHLEQPVKLGSLHSLALTFAGGFAPIKASLVAKIDPPPSCDETGADALTVVTLFPLDGNGKQYFAIGPTCSSSSSSPPGSDQRETDSFRLDMEGSTDAFGRITVYGIELYAIQKV
ncbi:hypothetical protein IE53DRAFT_383258 [Violaceomyces palustris]|uniref:Uncharacterized protein n=1 Tax=Violaceomyces palustris TaxID=1673888 RepID=A0ACD0P7N5_9BASI|nr:hypothetical protein IE53DRAFT_383258 [Violaceomyces palustris]